jgi:hypothetical protein
MNGRPAGRCGAVWSDSVAVGAPFPLGTPGPRPAIDASRVMVAIPPID